MTDSERPYPASRKPDGIDADEDTFRDEIRTVVKRHAHTMSYGELAYYLIMCADAMMVGKGVDRDIQELPDDEADVVPGGTHEVIIRDPADDFAERRIPLWPDYDRTPQGQYAEVHDF